MRIVLGILFWIAAILVTGYIIIWWGIVEPIMSIAEMVDTDTLTASAVGWEVIKFMLREVLGTLVGIGLYFIGGLIMAWE